MAVRSSAESDASISSEKAWAAGAAPLLPFLEPPGRAGIFFFFPALPPPPGSGGGIAADRGAPEVAEASEDGADSSSQRRAVER